MKQLILLMTALMLFSCGSSSDVAGGTGVGNPGDQSTVGITATKVAAVRSLEDTAVLTRSESALVLADKDGVSFTVEKLHMTVSHIRWQTDESYDVTTVDPQLDIDDGHLVLKGPLTYDLLSGDLYNGNRIELALPEARYKHVRLGLENETKSSIITVEGKITSGDVVKPFRFELPLQFHKSELLFKKHGAPVALGHAEQELSLVFELKNWFSSIDLLHVTGINIGDSVILDAENVDVEEFYPLIEMVEDSGSRALLVASIE